MTKEPYKIRFTEEALRQISEHLGDEEFATALAEALQQLEEQGVEAADDRFCGVCDAWVPRADWPTHPHAFDE